MLEALSVAFTASLVPDPLAPSCSVPLQHGNREALSCYTGTEHDGARGSGTRLFTAVKYQQIIRESANSKVCQNVLLLVLLRVA